MSDSGMSTMAAYFLGAASERNAPTLPWQRPAPVVSERDYNEAMALVDRAIAKGQRLDAALTKAKRTIADERETILRLEQALAAARAQVAKEQSTVAFGKRLAHKWYDQAEAYKEALINHGVAVPPDVPIK